MSSIMSPTSSSQTQKRTSTKQQHLHSTSNTISTTSPPTSKSFIESITDRISALFTQNRTVLTNAIPSSLSSLPAEYTFALLKRRYTQLRFKLERSESEEKELILVVWSMFVLRDYILLEGAEEQLNLPKSAAGISQNDNTTLWHLLNAQKLSEYEHLIEKQEKAMEHAKKSKDTHQQHHHKEQLSAIIDACLKYRSLSSRRDVIQSFDSFLDCIHKLSGGVWKETSDIELIEDKGMRGAHGEIGNLRVRNVPIETLVGSGMPAEKASDNAELYQDGVDLEEDGHVDQEHYIPRESQEPPEEISGVKDAEEVLHTSDDELDEVTDRVMNTSAAPRKSGNLARSHEMCFHGEC